MKRRYLSWQPFSRIVLIQAAVIICVLSTLGVGARFYFKHLIVARTQAHMRDLLESISHQIPPGRQFNELSDLWCLKVARNTQYRLTVIAAADGKVLCDTVYDSAGMTPLLDRPEVQGALKSETRFGESLRFSPTMSEDAYYGTRYLSELGVVLRAGVQLSELSQTIRMIDRAVIFSVFALIAFLTAALYWSGRKLLFPFASSLVEQTTKNMREDFVANVSHELRTPLTSIKGFADTILSDLGEGRKIEREFVEIISQDSTRLLTLVNDLLDLSAMDAGALEIEKEPVETRSVTETALTRLKAVFGHKKQTIKTTFEIDQVFADPDRLIQILLNLAGNAMKYSPEGAEVAVRWKNEAGDAVLEISDTGPGIAGEDQTRLFERFYRVDHDLGNERGTGLGLSIVKHLVNLHDATIELESESGRGSCFRVCFPARS